ncbi:MAG: hypothetical protein EA402_00480 [Planctomycetota bacterium]|nr:MAG: hypothetical protein EA402_00480 [Planctomycetota bacterium]
MATIDPSLLALISEIKNISIIDPEKTIFSIGGRGYYENTCSDVLCFFMDPNECHGLDDLVLRSFLRLLPCITEDSEPAMLTRAPVREDITTDNKRLDIVLWLNHCVIAIENKIRHSANNPFSQYENYIKSTAKQGEKAFFVLLTPHRSAGPDNWINITYEDLICSIECEMGQGFSSTPITKWIIFLRDFLLNLRNHTVRSAMHTEHRAFIESNFSALSKMIQLEKEYTEEVLREVQAHLSNWPIKSIKREDWNGYGTALRINVNNWSKCNMVLLHKYNDPPEGPRPPQPSRPTQAIALGAGTVAGSLG